jgi:hypothetical protein
MIDQLLHQLQSPDANTRRKAIMALANTKDTAALVPLAHIYRNDPLPELRDLALKAGRYIREHAGTAPGAAGTAADKERITDRDIDLAKGYLDAAVSFHTQGDRARAIENLGKALSLNPPLIKQTFVANLTLSLTGRSVDEAAAILTHPDRRADLIQKLGGKRKLKPQVTDSDDPYSTSWMSVLADLGIYWLVTSLATIAIFIFSIEMIQDVFDQYATTTTTAPGATSPEEVFDDIAAASFIAMIPMAFGNGVYSMLGVIIQGAGIHVAATYFLAGSGPLAYLYRRLVPFQTVITLGYAATFVVLSVTGSVEVFATLLPFLSIVASVAVIYYMSSLVGKVYNFGAGTGCLAIILGSVLVIAFFCCGGYMIFGSLWGVLNAVG